MHVLVTGAAGLIGSNVLLRLIEEGHTVTATDLNRRPPAVIARLDDLPSSSRARFIGEVTGDLTQPAFVDEVFAAAKTHAKSGALDGVMHIGGIRSPVGLDPRVVHNVNVTASYNVLQTAGREGVTRVVQASSCNALGLSWTRPEHWSLDFVPINETHPMQPVSQGAWRGRISGDRKPAHRSEGDHQVVSS